MENSNIYLKFKHLFSNAGYSRRKYRDPCRRVLSLLMSMRIDKYYTKPIVWDKALADSNNEQFELMSYEAMRAVNLFLLLTRLQFLNIFPKKISK